MNASLTSLGSVEGFSGSKTSFLRSLAVGGYNAKGFRDGLREKGVLPLLKHTFTRCTITHTMPAWTATATTSGR